MPQKFKTHDSVEDISSFKNIENTGKGNGCNDSSSRWGQQQPIPTIHFHGQFPTFVVLRTKKKVEKSI